MKIRKFQAKTTKEALEKAKKELGPDALILSVKKGGLLNKYVEVTAAIDNPQELIEETKDIKVDAISELSMIQDQIKEIKEIIRSLIPKGSFGSSVIPFFQQVRKRGISEEIALRIIEALEEGILKDGLDRDISLKDFLYELLSKLVEIHPPIYETEKRIALFIGPTGSGKTTTLAKIAGQLIKNSFEIGLISLNDKPESSLTLEFYAEMFQIPVSIVKDESELRNAISSYEDKDFILVDTPGIGLSRELIKKKMIDQIRILGQPLIYMVLDIRMKEEEILSLIQKIRPIEINSLIFTRVDEAETVGTMFNQMIYTGKPLSYIGTGSSVPDDIELLTPFRLIELIINRGEEDVERGKGIRKGYE